MSAEAILGIGTDLVEIDRFRDVLARRGEQFQQRIFCEGERAYAYKANDPAPRLAARFAAKEAVMKALGVGLGAFGLAEVEVIKQESGAPVLLLHGRAAELAADHGVSDWKITLSHSERTASAFVIALG